MVGLVALESLFRHSFPFYSFYLYTIMVSVDSLSMSAVSDNSQRLLLNKEQMKWLPSWETGALAPCHTPVAVPAPAPWRREVAIQEFPALVRM